MDKRGLYTYEPSVYTPEGARASLTPTEARKEYMRLRSIAMKRLARLEGTEFRDSQIVKKYKKLLIPSSKVPEKQLGASLYDVRRFLNLKTSTVRGARAAKTTALSTLHMHGYTGVTKDNFESFGRYMQMAREKSIGRWFDSERAAMTFEEQYEAALDDEDNIELSMEAFHQWELETIRERARMRRRSARDT